MDHPPLRASLAATIVDEPTRLEIGLPVRPNWFLLLQLTTWLAAWMFGVASVLRILTAGGAPRDGSPLLLWLGLWMLAGAWVGYGLLYNALGRTDIIIAGHQMVIRRHVWNLGSRRVLELGDIADVRFLPEALYPWRVLAEWFNTGRGGIELTYRQLPFRFAHGLSATDGPRVVAAIRHRLPDPPDQ
jgi:hypothetical protein